MLSIFKKIILIESIKNKSHLYLFCRKSVTVRFAPSPTGYLHLGGLRTALYNHLFALSLGGKKILRIEDTDQERKVEGAITQLVDDLTWCGLIYDEGPILQSERLDLYREYVGMLIDNGHAYRCFCTSSRLDIIRREAVKAGQIPRYDNRCRNIAKEKLNENLKRKVPFCVRFKLSRCLEPIQDLVYGEITHDIATLEGDPVILKTDGFPTYHLANVVDDHDMGVTHVLRGVEWQVSTKKHVLLHKALGWEPPIFAHLPLLLNPDGSKLSKRQGDVHVRHFCDKGLFPLALVNFVVRAGGGFDIKPWERDIRSYTLNELAEKFDLRKVRSSSCKVSFDKLDVSNQLELQRQLHSPQETQQLVHQLQLLISCYFSNSDYFQSIDISEAHVTKVLQWTQNRIHYLHDLVSPAWQFLWVLPRVTDLSTTEMEAIAYLLTALNKVSFEPEDLIQICKSCAETLHIKFAVVMKLLRNVLSGLKEGPGVIEMMVTLGKETVLQRLEEARQQRR